MTRLQTALIYPMTGKLLAFDRPVLCAESFKGMLFIYIPVGCHGIFM
jgi:hypothetical protein